MPDSIRGMQKHWEDLLLKSQRGDKGAYKELLTNLYPFINRKIQSKLGHWFDCDDITQDCLIGIHHSLPTHQPGKPLIPWINGIIQHKIADHFRLLRKRNEVEIFESDHPVTNLESSTNNSLDHEKIDRVKSMTSQLPKPLQRAIFLTKYKGLTYIEASAQEGISESAMRKRVSRAYGQLRKMVFENLEK